MRGRETSHLRPVDDGADLDLDLAVVAHARALEEGLGGRAAMVAAHRAGGIDVLRAELDAALGDVAELQLQLDRLRATITQAAAA